MLIGKLNRRGEEKERKGKGKEKETKRTGGGMERKGKEEGGKRKGRGEERKGKERKKEGFDDLLQLQLQKESPAGRAREASRSLSG